MSLTQIPAMLTAATQALNHAYCPYSNFPVAACIETEDGTLFTGANMENASYPLCLCAEANALGSLVSAGHHHIVRCLILTTASKLTAPCGACRQLLYEFANPSLPIYLYNTAGQNTEHTLGLLLPDAFGPQDLET